MAWEIDGYPSHQGTVGVLLPDSTEPGSVFLDAGSGSHVHESTDWWIYDGTFRAPLADRMRARCACGWRSEHSHPIDWDQVDRRDPWKYDTSGPRQDWRAHVEQVQALTVPLPAAVTELLDALRDHLDRLVDDGPLAALKAVHELETIVATTTTTAAAVVAQDDHLPWPRIAEALGTTEDHARSRLFRYARLL